MILGITLCRWRMYLRHFSPDTEPQNSLIPSTSSSFVFGLISLLMYSFSSCHIFSMGFRSGDSGGVFHYLILLVVKKSLPRFEVCLGSLSFTQLCSNKTCTVKIYLHKSVAIREHLLDEWNQSLLQDIDVHWGVHNPIKYADSSPATHTNASPYVDLDWMFCPAD